MEYPWFELDYYIINFKDIFSVPVEVKNRYPPQYSPEVFNKVMKQVENFEEYSDTTIYINETTVSNDNMYEYVTKNSMLMVAEESVPYGNKN